MTSLLDIIDWTPEYFVANRPNCNVILENLDILKKIPSLNNVALHKFKDQQLVRFKGMIQDMHDPEYYLQLYEVKNTETETHKLKCGMYADSIKCLPHEMILLESEKNQTSERYSCIVISIPGLNNWAKESCKQLYCSHIQKKEKLLPIDADEKTEDTMKYDTKQQCAFSKDFILNFPIPMDDGIACIVKIYEDMSLKVNETIEIVGFISLDSHLNMVYDSDETMTKAEITVHHPPTSLVPRLHAIKIIRSMKQDIKVVPQIMSKAELIRSDLHLILSQLLFGDHLAADYLICHLLSSIYVRRDYFSLGTYPLNITHFPAYKYKEFPKNLYKFLTLLIEKSYLLEITLKNLNDLTLLPKKDYECNRLTSGLLQLSDNTHVVIDETGLTTGEITQIGRENYNAICDLVNFQKVTYDFKFYKLEYETDIPVLILSEAKSFIPCQIQVVLKIDSNSKSVYPEIMKIAERYLQDQNRLINIQQYLKMMRDMKFDLNDEDVIKVLDIIANINDYLDFEIQNDFIQWKQTNKNVDRLHSLMVLARLLSLSYGSNTLTTEYWKKAVEMEVERLNRLTEKKEI